MATMREEMVREAERVLARQRRALGSASTGSTPGDSSAGIPTEEARCFLCGGPALKSPGFEGDVPCLACHKLKVDDIFRRKVAEQRLERAGLLRGPAAHMRLDTFRRELPFQREALEVVSAWLRGFPHEFGESVLLWSRGFGVGKTHLARAVQRRVLEAGGTANFHLMASVLGAIRESYGGVGESEQAIIARMTQPQLLVWDDLGKEYVSERGKTWFYNIVFRIVDARYRAGLPMLVTSNASPCELAEAIGGASSSRVMEMCGSRVVDMSGPDWRLG